MSSTRGILSILRYHCGGLPAVAELDARRKLLKRLRRRLGELRLIVAGLSAATTSSLERLESLTFDPKDDAHLEQFQETALLIRSLREVLQAAPIGDDGGPSTDSDASRLKYKSYATQQQEIAR